MNKYRKINRFLEKIEYPIKVSDMESMISEHFPDDHYIVDNPASKKSKKTFFKKGNSEYTNNSNTSSSSTNME